MSEYSGCDDFKPLMKSHKRAWFGEKLFVDEYGVIRTLPGALDQPGLKLDTSGGAAAPLPRITGYAVSKVGIVRFIESLSEELKDYNIDVNSVAPGTVNTSMLNEILAAGPKKIGKNAYAKAIPPLGSEHHQKTIQGFVKEFVYLLPQDTSGINS